MAIEGQNIRIRLKAFDHRVLDQSTGEIVVILGRRPPRPHSKEQQTQ